jgi:response regulator NasT
MPKNVKGCHRVLFVDDDPEFCRVVEESMVLGILDRTRFSIETCASGDEALSLCRSSHYDLVVLDYNMPGTSGVDVAKVLHGLGVTFLFISAHSDRNIVDQAAKTGASAYLVKPVGAAEIEAALHIALSRADDLKHLNHAIEVSGIVSNAAGVIMGAEHRTQAQALQKLRSYCEPRNLTLRSVCETFIEQFESEVTTRGKGSGF